MANVVDPDSGDELDIDCEGEEDAGATEPVWNGSIDLTFLHWEGCDGEKTVDGAAYKAIARPTVGA